VIFDILSNKILHFAILLLPLLIEKPKKLNMKKIICLAALLIAFVVCIQPIAYAKVPSKAYSIKKGMIHFKEPARAKGQTSMLGFAAEPIDTVRVGIIGLGMRGKGPLKRMSFIEGVKIVAICDLYQEKINKSQERLAKYKMPRADEYVGEDAWKQLCQREDIDLVYIVTDWGSHTPMAVYAMEHGKHVAIEVPAATSVAECWQLVDTSERTRKHCMMLENCIYDQFELTTLNMAQQGLFGEIVHAEGAYIHALDPWWDKYHDCWRLKFNQAHDGDVYPTHGLGPVCFALNIHRGDRMTHLVSMDTESWCGKADFAKAFEAVRRSGLFIGVDSAPLHLARLCAVPALSIWGATSPYHLTRNFENYSETLIVADAHCTPCVHRKNVYCPFEKSCTAMVKVNSVLTAAESLLDNPLTGGRGVCYEQVQPPRKKL
jgi:hypothetical protein